MGTLSELEFILVQCLFLWHSALVDVFERPHQVIHIEDAMVGCFTTIHCHGMRRCRMVSVPILPSLKHARLTISDERNLSVAVIPGHARPIGQL